MSAIATRPGRLIGVIGTTTGIGKTWVATQVLATLKLRGARVAARKPVQSYGPDDINTDAALLAGASGENVADICPAHRCYPLAMAPPMAAHLLGRGPLLMKDIVREVHWPDGIDVGVVETVGGARSPLSRDGDSMDLLRQLQVDEVLLVADAALGTINMIRLTLAAIGAFPTLVYLNRFDANDELHELNRRWLVEEDGLRVVTDVHYLAMALETTAKCKHA